MSEAYHERVPFRLFQMPCCGTLICWVNARRPGYCPECGKLVFHRLREAPELTKFSDDEAVLTVHGRLPL